MTPSAAGELAPGVDVAPPLRPARRGGRALACGGAAAVAVARRLARALDAIPTSVAVAAVLVLFPLGCALAALAIGQDANYDLLNYHFYDPYAFLHGRLSIDVYPAQLQSLLNPLLDLPTYLLIEHAPPRLEAVALGAFQGLAPALVCLVARRAGASRTVALAAAIAAATGGGFVSEIGSSMGDAVVAVPLLLGVLLALRAVEAGPSKGGLWWWAAAGLAAGIGSGLKLAELPVGLGIVLGSLAVGAGAGARLRALRLGAAAAGGVAGTLATSGYWFWFLWRHYRDPIAFTQATFGIFHSPYVPTAHLRGGFLPSSPLAGLAYPIRWLFHPTSVGEIDFRALSMPLAYVLTAGLVVTLLVRAARSSLAAARRSPRRTEALGPAVRIELERRGASPSALLGRTGATEASEGMRADADRYLLVAFAVGIAVWMEVFSVYRYVIPLELLSPVVILAAARRLVALGERSRSMHRTRPSAGPRRAVVPGFLLACVACVVTTSPGNYWERVPFGRAFFSLRTPSLLENGRVDALVEVGGLPMGYIFPQLPPRIIGIGGIGDLLTPANRSLVHRALARVSHDGGTINVVFVDVPERGGLSMPKGTPAYLADLGARGLVATRCEVVEAGIGAGHERLKLCRLAQAAS